MALTGAVIWTATPGCGRKPSAAVAPQATALPATFVGSASCAECHAQQAGQWKGSHHDLAMQEATDATVLGDFRDASFTYYGVTSTFFRRDGKFMVRTDSADGSLQEYEVAYTFGVDPLQQYLIRFPEGRIQALNICWDTRPAAQGGQRWFHLYPDDEIRHDDILHWTGPYQNWNFMCAECHSTNVRKGYEAEKDRFATEWSEINVACESCHGPGSAHVAWARSGSPKPKGRGGDTMGLVVRLKEDPPAGLTFNQARGIVFRDRPRTDHAEIETCARCHSRRGTFSEDYKPGGPLADTHRLALLEPSLYEADGQIKDEVYEYGSFLQSKMYAAGVTCTDCHDPHTLKTAGGNATCARCHVPDTFDTPAHTRHKAGTQAAQCISCHAPTRNYMVVHARHDHSFRVPRPDLTVKIGTPNACNSCHADQTAEWAASAAERLWGPRQDPQPHYGEVLAAGRKGLPGASDRLAELLNDRSRPAIVRASAAELLDGAEGPVPTQAIEGALKDADPQVRAAAVRSLRSIQADAAELAKAAAPLLTDPVRQVRMDAAVTLASLPRDVLTPEQAAAFGHAVEEYRSAEMYSADRAESRLNLGVLAIDEGDAPEAERQYVAAIRVSPRFAAAYVNLADLYRAQGREEEAEKTIRRGLEEVPRDSALHHALGLALARQRRLDEAVSELGKALEYAPENARYAYVFAVALEATGKRDQAIEVLIRAHATHPADAEIVEALAGYCRDAGRIDDAVSYAEQLVSLRPGDAGAAEFLRQLRVLKGAPAKEDGGR